MGSITRRQNAKIFKKTNRNLGSQYQQYEFIQPKSSPIVIQVHNEEFDALLIDFQFVKILAMKSQDPTAEATTTSTKSFDVAIKEISRLILFENYHKS